MPLVTVVIPCYNHGCYVLEAVASVRDQTLRDWEIIVVDDGSTEPIPTTVTEQLEQYGVRIIVTPNRGPAAARNTGIAAGTGKYILPLDADDRIAPGYLEKAVALLEKSPDLGIVYCLADFFGTQSGRWPLPDFKLPDFVFQPSIFNAAVFRRADWMKVGGYFEEMRTGYEDHDFWLGILELKRKVFRIEEVLFFYRRLPMSLAQSITRDQQVAAYLKMQARHPALFAEHLGGLFRLWLSAEARAEARHLRPLLQIFLPNATDHNEADSVRTTYAGGSWTIVELALPVAADAPDGTLRLDPGMQAGCYQLDQVTLLDANDGRTLQEWNGPQLARDVRVVGTAMRLPDTSRLSLFSFGRDPQLLFPPTDSAGLRSAKQPTLRIRILFDPEPENLAPLFVRLGDSPASVS